MEDKLKDVVIFGAEWCNVCQQVKALFDKEGTAYTYIDVDSAAGKLLAEDYNVRGLPLGMYQGQRVLYSLATARRWLEINGSKQFEGEPQDEAVRLPTAPFQPQVGRWDNLVERAAPVGIADLLRVNAEIQRGDVPDYILQDDIEQDLQEAF